MPSQNENQQLAQQVSIPGTGKISYAQMGQNVHQLIAQNAGLMGTIQLLNDRVKVLEEKFREMGYTTKRIVQSEIANSYTVDAQAETMYGMQLGLCISTIDPLKQNRVRFYHPAIHRPHIPMKALPFAYPISAGFPGFDDCGVCWVPPAGTAVCLIFQNGHRDSPYYFGSIWNRNRGNPPTWAYPVQEYQDIWAGTRFGYLIGKNNETQVFPPWNTWNYNGFDTDTQTEFEKDPEASKRITYPHIYGIKTPEKAFIRWHDGDRKCNLRWKHTEICSSRGNFIIMKDDHLHPCGQWASPKCGCGGGDASLCGIEEHEKLMGEQPTCCKCGDENCPGGPTCPKDPAGGQRCANKYFKRYEECRPYRGSPTPLNPKAWLPQTGIHMQSIAGHHMEMDDSVQFPTGKPTWDREFDFGCTDRFVGKMWLMSATGHSIVLNDHENLDQGCDPTRSEQNYIRIQSASGNRIELNDHTIPCSCPPGIAGAERGIQMNTTSRHILYMIDKDNEQCAPKRRYGGVPINKAKNAYCILRSGYGLHVYLNDYHSQEVADRQFLQLLAPQIGNTERGPHLEHMQVRKSGPGLILIRAGGILWESSYDHSVETVGEGKHRAHKIIDVVGIFLTNCDDAYVNVNKLTFFKADEFIVLGAGLDCPIPEHSDQASELANATNTATEGIVQAVANGQRVPIRDKCGPCFAPLLCLDPQRGVIVFSDRVFVSTSPKAPCCPLQLFVGSPSGRTCPPPGKTCLEKLAESGGL
jgi:hypothetical protein